QQGGAEDADQQADVGHRAERQFLRLEQFLARRRQGGTAQAERIIGHVAHGVLRHDLASMPTAISAAVSVPIPSSSICSGSTRLAASPRPPSPTTPVKGAASASSATTAAPSSHGR